MAIAMILYNRRSNFNIIFFGLLIIFYAVGVVSYYFLAFEQTRFWVAVFYGNLAPLWYLPGPLLYFYVRGSIQDTAVLKKWDFLHLLPFAVSLAGLVPYILTPFSYKLSIADAIVADLNNIQNIRINVILPHKVNMVLRPLLIIIYAIVAMGMVLHAQRRFAKTASVPRHQWHFFRNWLLFLCGLILFFTIPSLLITPFFLQDYNQSKGGWIDDFFSISLGFPLFIFPAILVSFPQILYGMPQLRKIKGVSETEIQKKKASNDLKRDAEVSAQLSASQAYQIENDPFAALAAMVLQTMKEKQPYLDPGFSLDNLAELLEVPKHHLYYCFQNHLHTKFTSLRTQFRVEHAKTLLTESDLHTITIDAVGRNSGFASKTSFYTIFKSELGISPGEYAQLYNRMGYKNTE